MNGSKPLDGMRRREALLAGAGALGLLGVAGVSLTIRSSEVALTSLNSQVLPKLASQIRDVVLIRVTLKSESYSFVRESGGLWTMPERGNYSVDPEKLTALATSLTTVSFKAVKTRDLAQLDRLGLGDPRAGGTGALVELMGAANQSIARLILGVRPSGTYYRRPDDSTAYAVRGEMPPFQDPTFWLNFNLPLPKIARVVRVSVKPSDSERYTLARSPKGAFTLVSPEGGAASPDLAERTGLAISRWRPIDVGFQPLKDQKVSGVMDVVTSDGLALRGTAYEYAARCWIALESAALVPDRREEAAALNAQAAQWAFEFTRYDWKDWIRPLSEITQ